MSQNPEIKIKILESKKETLFRRIQRLYDCAKRINIKDELANFKVRYESLEQTKQMFEEIITQVNELHLQLDGDYVPNFAPLDAIDEMCCFIQKVAKEVFKPVAPAPTANPSQHSVVKLPKIELPSFSGAATEWPVFYETFKSLIHDNASVDPINKLHYLLGKLSGKALTVCSGISPTAANYPVIWTALTDKYQDNRSLANAYLDQIFNFKPAQTENPHCLNAFLEKFDAAVSALKNLNIEDLSDFMLSYMALSKIDKETAKLFEMSHRKNDTLPSYKEVLDFVREQSKILALNDKHSKIASTSSSYKSKSSPTPHSARTFLVNNANDTSNCPLCNSSHHLFLCEKFLNLSPKERFNFAKEKALCLNCLSAIHKVAACKSKISCRTCASRHHSLLHWASHSEKHSRALFSPVNVKPENSTPVKVEDRDKPGTSSFCSMSTEVNFTVLLPTAVVYLLLPGGKIANIRVIVDSGSQSNFLTLNCCKRFRLPVEQLATSVSGIGATRNICSRTQVTIASRFDVNLRYQFLALLVEKITDRLPCSPVNATPFEFLEGLPLADETFTTPGEIDGIIGAELFSKIIGTRKISGPSDVACAIETSLGYIVMGNAPVSTNNLITHSFCSFTESINELVEKFWKIEEVAPSSLLRQEDEECENFFKATYTRDDSGRYIVRLPFIQNPSVLGDSLAITNKRFDSLENRFKSSSTFKKLYVDAMQDQIDQGFMTKLSDGSPSKPNYYIPHHGVFKSNSSTPLRIVLDASTKTSNGISLNDILHKGPKLQSDVITVLLNFRLFEIAMTADLRKMFLQIVVALEDRCFQQILWRSSPEENLATYQLNRVAFGLKSSPYLALRTIRQLAADESQSFPLASQVVLRDTYMDDLVSSVSNVENAFELYQQLVQLFKSGGFDLVKWYSNCSELLKEIPKENHLSQTINFDENSSKVLGLQWHSTGDYFVFKVVMPDSKCSKRNVLSTIARIYDPLGLLAPIILYAKLIIREFWKYRLDWDADPPPHLVSLWMRFFAELHLLADYRVPRHLSVIESAEISLLGFADASKEGYGAIVFVRVLFPDNSVKVSLVCAKSKVSPIKTISIPRLELCAALLLAKLLNLVFVTYETRVTIHKLFAFSDSMITLHWIHAPSSRWKPFVANRVSKIQSLISPSNWFHIKGQENPSDCLSRGLTPNQFLNNRDWLNGPEWIVGDESLWPIKPFVKDDAIELEEASANFCATETQISNPILDLTNRVSSFKKLIAIMVYILRFVKILPLEKCFSANDLNIAESALARAIQLFYFRSELGILRKENYSPPNLKYLCPFIDSEGMIRVGGRLSNNDALNFDQKHPILLPKSCALVFSLIDFYHEKNMHAGPHLLLSLIRQKYWILSARGTIRKRLSKCNLCFRTKPRSNFPLMADLPSPRISASKAFLHTGVDYGGPYYITLSRKRGAKSQKAYICLFVCLATRALHLEVASDLSTDTFLAAFKRFLARRGLCAVMYSDCGTNFQGAKGELDSIYKFINSDEFQNSLKNELAENRIKWKFNPPSAPHFGGIWEAGIKSVKSHLHKVLGTQILSYEEFATLLAQIEALLNSRPLCWLSSDPSEPLPLTPAHFLTLTPLKHLPAADVTQVPMNRLSRKQLLDQLVQSYWKRWSLEYLNSLQTRQKWNTPSCPVKTGTLVIVRQDNMPPLCWPLGVVQEVFPGKDGLVRVAMVKTKHGIYKRPVVRLCPLPNQ